MHSVNKTPVRDFYEVRGGDIYVVETHYFSFGAGVQSELNDGETLEYGDDSSMRIKNINRRIPDLIYAVRADADHILEINGVEISLSGLCGGSGSVRFTVSGG